MAEIQICLKRPFELSVYFDLQVVLPTVLNNHLTKLNYIINKQAGNTHVLFSFLENSDCQSASVAGVR